MDKQLISRVALIVMRVVAVLMMLYAILTVVFLIMMIRMISLSLPDEGVGVTSVSMESLIIPATAILIGILSIPLWFFAPRLSRLIAAGVRTD